MLKFGRNYSLTVETLLRRSLVIEPPFTVEFDITRNILTSANVCSLRIYNLNANHRAQIRKNVTDYGDLRLVQFKAGYGDNLSIAFTGNITQAWSVREGTNFITQIESFDGGYAFANSTTNLSFPPGTPQQVVVTGMVASLAEYGIQPGAVGIIPGVLNRGNAYSGNTTDLLKQLTGGTFFVDNGKAYVLGNDEALLGQVTSITPASGLLGTPVYEQSIINFDMLFEPKLVAGQLITLVSTTEPIFSGIYKVVSIKHRGTISDAVCGSAITSVGLLGGVGFKTIGVAA